MDTPSSGNTGPFPVIPHEILVKQKDGQAISIWLIGAFCIYGWELFICAPKEYRLVWKKPLNKWSLLYLTNRYFGLIEFCFTVSLTTDVWSPSACKHVYLFNPIAGLVSTILSQAILGGRVFAIYSRNKALGYLLGGILLAEAIVGAISSSTTSLPPLIPGVPPSLQPPCGALQGPFKWLITYWTMPLLYDLLTFLLTARKAYGLWKRQAQTRLFDIIWFDGLVYFFANLAMNVVNVMIFFLAPSSLQDFNMAPTIMFQIILSCRMFLHLRGFDHRAEFVSEKPNSNHIKFRSHLSNGTAFHIRSDSTRTSEPDPIVIDTKRATRGEAQTYELQDVRTKPSESVEGWNMA